MNDNTLLSIFSDDRGVRHMLEFIAKSVDSPLNQHTGNVWSFTSRNTDRQIFNSLNPIVGSAEIFLCRIGSRDWCSNRKSSGDCYQYQPLDNGYRMVSIHSPDFDTYKVVDGAFRSSDDCHVLTNVWSTRAKPALYEIRNRLIDVIGGREYELFLCDVLTGETLTFVQQSARPLNA